MTPRTDWPRNPPAWTARAPEELETILEDALLTRDRSTLAGLFTTGALFVAGDGPGTRGEVAICRAALATWRGPGAFVAATERIVHRGDLALIVSANVIGVARRDAGGAWRYDILLARQHRTEKEPIMTIPAQPLMPVTVAAEEGEARWWFGGLAVIKATAASTGGQMTIIEITEPPGEAAPLHVHHREDEAFWILEGSATFEIGDEVVEAQAGDYLFGPRDIPHRYTVGDAGCRMLFILTPGGFEALVIAMSRPAESRTLPPPSDEEPDWDHVAAIAARNGAELLG